MYKLEEIEELRDLGLLTIIPNPNNKYLWLLNYTDKAQFEKAWYDYPNIVNFRGMVIDWRTMSVVARPFPKFFNYEEYHKDDIPNTREIEVTMKVDGSLLIVFQFEGVFMACTRGSWSSWQSLQGIKLFNERLSYENLPSFRPDCTYLFEYIGPENMIVVRYDKENIIFLAEMYNNFGYQSAKKSIEGFDSVERINVFGDMLGQSLYRKLKDQNLRNEEGFVVRDIDTDWRCKIKFEDYIFYHKTVSGLNRKRVWEALCTNKMIDLIKAIPDELYPIVHQWEEELLKAFDEKATLVEEAWNNSKHLEDQKEFALFILEHYKPLSSMLFAKKSGRDYSEIIWDGLKPVFIDPQTEINNAKS